MVSGFLTSPYDHERIFSGEASPILIASNSSSCWTCLKSSRSAFISVPLQVDVDTQGTDFLHQHVERLGHAGVDLVIALDDVLVHLGAAVDVVGLDREHLLQRVRGTVGF